MTACLFALVLALPQGVACTAVNPAPAARSALVTVALPFARGELRVADTVQQIAVTTADGAEWPARVAFRWPDGSAGLLHAQVQVKVAALGSTDFALTPRRGDDGMAKTFAAPPHRPLLPDSLPLHTELVDPWGRTLTARLEPDPSAGPGGVLWDTGLVRARRFRSRHRLGAEGGAPFLGLRAWLVTTDGSRSAELTLLLDNSDLGLGPVRFTSFALVTTDGALRFLPEFAAEQGLPSPEERSEGGFRQTLLRPGEHYLGDGTAKAFRIHLFQEANEATDAERQAAGWVTQPIAAFPALASVRASAAFGAHGGPAPAADEEGSAAGSQYLSWRSSARFGPYGGFGDPENGGVQGTARNGPCALHNVLRWQSPLLWLCAEGMALQQTLRPTPGRNPGLPEGLAPYRQGIGPLGRTAPHGFTAPDYEHFSVILLYDWWWLTGDALARDELARLGRGLRAELAAVPYLTSRGEGWCLQSGVLIARATDDAALLEWLRRRCIDRIVPAMAPADSGCAIAQPAHPDALGDHPFDASWQMAALAHGLHALWRATGDEQVRSALLRTADGMVGPAWLDGSGPKYFVSARDPVRYTIAADPVVQEGVVRMVAAALALAVDAQPDEDRSARYQSCLDQLLERILPPQASPALREAVARNPWLQVVLDRRERPQ